MISDEEKKVVTESLAAYESQIASVDAYVDFLRLNGWIFMASPPLKSGGYAEMPRAIEEKCVDAVVQVLLREVATMKDKALKTRKLLSR